MGQFCLFIDDMGGTDEKNDGADRAGRPGCKV